MLNRPAVAFVAAGLFLCMGCGNEPATSPFPSTGSSSESTRHTGVQLSCTSYCNHVYGTATECDEDTLAVEASGCHGFCSAQAQSVSDECADALIDAYDCIVDERVAYACANEESSPSSTEDTCEAEWLAADACVSE